MKTTPQTEAQRVQPATPAVSLRSESRRQVFRAAIIVYGPEHTQVPCSILNVSSSGARITTKWASKLPDRFRLVNGRYKMDLECEVRWQLEDDLGVRFLSPNEAAVDNARQSGSSTRTHITKINNPRPGTGGKTFI